MPKNVGPYGKLLANYQDDDAIIAAGEKAELLFCRAIAFLSNSDSDGYITDGQLLRRVGAGMTDAKKRADTLVREGLWERVEGGYQVRSYLKINDSAEDKGRRRRTDRERKQRERTKDSDPVSEWNPSGQDAESKRTRQRTPSGVTTDSLTGLLTDLRSTEVQSSPVNASDATDADRDSTRTNLTRFDEFWTAFPKRVAKQAARRKWETLIRRGVDPDAIIHGAKRYAEEVRGSEPQFIKQPDGWLNAGRWEDEPPRPPSRPSTPWAGA